MAQIPIGNFGQSVAAPQRGPRITGTDAGLITTKAVGDLAGAVQGVATDQIAAQTRLDIEAYNADAQTSALKARITKQNDLQDAASKLSQQVMDGSVSRDKAAEEWQTRSQDIMRGATDGLDPKYAGHVQAELDGHVQQFGHVINAAVIKRTQEDNRSNVFTLVDQYERLAATNRQKAIDELFPQLDAVGPKAGYGPDDIAKLKKSFKEKTSFTDAYALVKSSGNSLAAVADARKALSSDRFSDLDPQKAAVLHAQLDGYETNILQRQAIAEQRAAAHQQAVMNRAQAAFTAAQARIDSGIPESDEQVSITTQALAGTPFLDTYRALQANAREFGGFGAQPIAAQQAALDRINAEIAQRGQSEALIKRRDHLQRILEATKRDYGEDPLRAAVQRGVINSLPPIDLSSVEAIAKTVGARLEAARIVRTRTDRPVSPLTSDEAKQLADTIKTLPVQQRSTAIATLANAIGPQASAGLAMQLQPAKEDAAPQDRALGLAFGYATAKTTYGRYTSELILKGQQALADKTVKIEKGAEFGWQAEIAKQVEGAYPNQQQAEAVKQAAYLITAGMASEGSPDVARAVRLAAGGDIVEVNGRKIPVKPGVDQNAVINRLRTITPDDFKAQAPDNKVRVGGAEVPLDSFVANLKDAQLVSAGGGRYNVLAGGRLVTNTAGQRVSLEVSPNAR